MTYDPGDNIQFTFSGTYTPPRGNCIEIRLGGFAQVCELFMPARGTSINLDLSELVPETHDFSFNEKCFPVNAPEEIIPACIEVEPYVAPTGTNVHFDFYKAYDWPTGTVDLELADCAEEVPPEPPPPWYQIPSAISPGIRMGFESGTAVDKGVESPWSAGRLVEPSVEIGYGDEAAIERGLDIVWQSLGQLYRSNRIAWGRLLVYDPRLQAVWKNLQGHDHGRRCPYGSGDPIDDSLDLSWQNPGEKDKRCQIAFDQLRKMDVIDFDVPWGNPPPKDREHHTCWGPKYYEEICTRDYLPPAGNAIDIDLHKDITEVGDKDHIHFWFDSLSHDLRCNHREPSGWRDAYTYDPPGLIPYGAVRRYYVMNNSASLTRISDSAPIEVKSLGLKCDVDSFCWSLSADIGSDAALGLVDPEPAGPVETEALINGYRFVCQTEGWQHGQRFTGADRKVRGRSLSAVLAAPAAIPLTFIEDNQRTARQIAEAVLQYTGWTLDWQMVDWLIPGGVFSCDGHTPMQVVKTIAETGYGIVLTHMEDKTLIVQPRYPIMPWDWATATPDVIIPEDMVTRIDGDWDPRPGYNAAFVSGTVTGGVSVKVIRNGSAGDVAAPMLTDPLITTTAVGTAKGSGVLASSGEWSTVRCGLPVMSAPDQPGVLLPGMLIEVTGDETWRAMVVGNSVNAVWRRSLIVRQAVDLERYHGS